MLKCRPENWRPHCCTSPEQRIRLIKVTVEYQFSNNGQDFHRLRGVLPEINEALLLFLARRVRTVYDTLDDAYLLDMPHRLGRRLWVLYRASLREDPAGKITISHEDLAMMIGSSRQSVTGILKGWEREGWLVQACGHIELLLADKLLRFNSE